MTTFTLTAHDWDQAKGPCCGVLACAIAAQKPFKDTWAWFKNFGGKRYKHHNWKGRTFHSEYPKWFEHAGVKTKHYKDHFSIANLFTLLIFTSKKMLPTL